MLMPKTITIKMTLDEAHAAGLIVCGRCGWPKNNHFKFAPHECAHAECKGYVEKARVGRLVKQRRLSKRKLKSKGAKNGK